MESINKWKNLVTGLALASVMFLFINAEHYPVTAFPSVQPGQIFSSTDVLIKVEAKAYTAEESQKILHRNLLMRGYQPVQISIHNNTSKSWVLYQEGIDLPVVSSKKVASFIIKAAIPRSIGFKLVSFFFWPFVIPSTIDSIRTLKAHAKLKKDFAAKSINPRTELVPAYSTVNRIFFVKLKDYPGKFTLTLMDQETQQLKQFPINTG